MKRSRALAADLLERVGCWCCRTAYEMRPPYTGPTCEDCGQPRPSDDEDDCPVCLEAWQQQRREREAYDLGAERAWDEARTRFGGEW